LAAPGWAPCDTPSQIHGPDVCPQYIPVDSSCPGGAVEPAEHEAAAYTARWRPSSVSPRAAAFARDVVTKAGPEGRERAKNLLWAAGKLADYAASLGLELTPGVVLHPSTAERFTRCAPGLSGVARRTRRPGAHGAGAGPLPRPAAGRRGVRRDRAGLRRRRSRPPEHHEPADHRAGRRDGPAPAGHLPVACDLAGRLRGTARPGHVHAC